MNNRSEMFYTYLSTDCDQGETVSLAPSKHKTHLTRCPHALIPWKGLIHQNFVTGRLLNWSEWCQCQQQKRSEKVWSRRYSARRTVQSLTLLHCFPISESDHWKPQTTKLRNKKTESSFKVRWVLSLVGFPCGCLRLSFPSISPAAQQRILQPRASKTYWTKKQKQKKQQKLQSRPLCSTLNRESQHLARTLTHSPDSYRQKLKSQHRNLWHINPTVCLERRHVPESWNVSKHRSLHTEISINWWNF